MLKYIVYVIFFPFVTFAGKEAAATERFVISSAYCIENSWNLVVLDNATGKIFRIVPNKRSAEKCGIIFENFNPNDPSIVIRIGSTHYLARMKEATGGVSTPHIEPENSEEFISNSIKDISFENPAISRSEILNNIRNLN